MKVAARRVPVEQSCNRGEHRISQILVQGGHSTWLDSTFETIPHDTVVVLSKLLDERTKVRKVVAVVSIAHDDVLTACVSDSPSQRTAITLLLDVNYSRAHVCGDVLRAVS